MALKGALGRQLLCKATRLGIPYCSSATYRRVATQICSSAMPEFDKSEIRSWQELHRLSVDDPTRFWGQLAKSRLSWSRLFDVVSDCDMVAGKFRWFVGGMLNISENCIDRHTARDPNRVALIWEKDEPGQQEYVSYRQLAELTSRLANVLKAHGVAKGDRVAIYMPNSPVAVAAMLACMRIGAVHSVVFAGFSADALATRINDAAANVVITADQAVRGGKTVELKRTVNAAVAKCPSVKHVLVYKRTGSSVPASKLDVDLDKAMAAASTVCLAEPMESEDTSFMLYTSGSTGKPKGIVHSTAGYLLYASVTHKSVFDYKDGDIFGCMADIGWITGHSYIVYGPLCNGATTVLFESVPTYPDPGRYWETVERLKLNSIYLAPTALRLLIKSGDTWPKKYNLSSLRTLGCVGEPLNHEAWEWYHHVIGGGRCPIVDTWWQTETGGICITPRPSAPQDEILPAMPMRPFFGIDPVLMDPDTKQEVTGDDAYGSLCIRRPWPGIARSIYGDHERYLNTYFKQFPGYYVTGDGAHRLPKGYYRITGRTDDVINISGHRLGTAEVEDVLDEHPDTAETAVIGFPHEIKGEGVYAYVTLKDSATKDPELIKQELREMVAHNIAKFAVPEHIQVVPGLPKTRSGKIMRRILRKVAAGHTEDLGDVTTLADPAVVPVLVKQHADMVARAAASAAAATSTNESGAAPGGGGGGAAAAGSSKR